MITQDIVKSFLNYDPETGKFTWLCFPGSNVHVGDEAGYIESVKNIVFHNRLHIFSFINGLSVCPFLQLKGW